MPPAGNPLNATHRPRSLLSGLLVCGCCGGPYALRGQDRFGCSTHIMNGFCANSRSITRIALEERVLAGLKDRLMAPEIAAEAIRAYAEETNHLNHTRRASGEAERKELDKIARTIKELVTQVEDGGGSRAVMARLRELEAREDELNVRLAQVPVDLPDIHPNIAEIYARKVARLAEALRHPAERDEAADAIRGLIEKITLSPGAKRGQLEATLYGDLGTILAWTARNANTPGLVGSGGVGISGCGDTQASQIAVPSGSLANWIYALFLKTIASSTSICPALKAYSSFSPDKRDEARLPRKVPQG